MLSKGMKIPELELSKEESAKLSDALMAVQEEYGFTVDPKILVWAQFAGAVSSIYAPRFMMYKVRVAAEIKIAEKKKQFEVQEALNNVTISPTV